MTSTVTVEWRRREFNARRLLTFCVFDVAAAKTVRYGDYIGLDRMEMFKFVFFALFFPRYMKYLYPFECEKKRLSTPAELQAAIDGNRREGRRASYGPYPDMVSLPPSVFSSTSSSQNEREVSVRF